MNIEQEKAVLMELSTQRLRERFAESFGYTPTSRNRPHMISKILWAIQRDTFGDIDQAVLKKATAVADDRFVKTRFPAGKSSSTEAVTTPSRIVSYKPEPALHPGTVLHRKYRGEDIRVLVLENGFEWDGQAYKSLSATARAITNTRWNGKLFFGLKKKGEK